MSVYIKGFPLPNNCGACPLRLAWCRERIYMVTRPERCPLIELPPHGRLIDADALIDKVIAKYLEHERKGELVFAAAEIKQDIVDIISDAPTIIEASPYRYKMIGEADKPHGIYFTESEGEDG